MTPAKSKDTAPRSMASRAPPSATGFAVTTPPTSTTTSLPSFAPSPAKPSSVASSWLPWSLFSNRALAASAWSALSSNGPDSIASSLAPVEPCIRSQLTLSPTSLPSVTRNSLLWPNR